MTTILPDCMMPDGGEPCKGYDQMRRHVEHLQAKLHCMCGSPIEGHGVGDGHTPVSMYDYALEQAEAQNKRLGESVATLELALKLAQSEVYKDAVLDGLRVRNAELLEFVKLYDATYASTQRHPTASEEVTVIAKARAILAKTKEEPANA